MLSEYILLEIFEYFSPREKCQTIALVCKKWNRLVRRKCLWKNIDFKETCEIVNSEILRRYGGTHTVCVKLPSLSFEISKLLVNKFKHLKSLRLSCDDNFFNDELIAVNFRELWLLGPRRYGAYIRYTHSTISPRSMQFLERLRLERVHISRDAFTGLVSNRCLKHVYFRECFLEFNIQSITNDLPNTLHSLCVVHCEHLVNINRDDEFARCEMSSLLPLAKFMMDVHVLHLERYSLSAIDSVLHRLCNVTNMSLSRCNFKPKKMTDSFCKLIDRMKNLHKLKFELCQFSDEMFKNSHITCKQLRSLKITLCSSFGKKSLRSLSKIVDLKVILYCPGPGDPGYDKNYTLLKKFAIRHEVISTKTKRLFQFQKFVLFLKEKSYDENS